MVYRLRHYSSSKAFLFLVKYCSRPLQVTDLLTEAAKISLTIRKVVIEHPFKVKRESSFKCVSTQQMKINFKRNCYS